MTPTRDEPFHVTKTGPNRWHGQFLGEWVNMPPFDNEEEAQRWADRRNKERNERLDKKEARGTS